MRDLKREPRQRDAGILGARANPVDACCVVRTVGIQPETRFPHIGFGISEAQGPEANVMALARAVVDRLLKTDVLTATEKIEGAPSDRES